jgi:hypothetical protein
MNAGLINLAMVLKDTGDPRLWNDGSARTRRLVRPPSSKRPLIAGRSRDHHHDVLCAQSCRPLQFLDQITVKLLFGLDTSRTACGNRDEHKVMAARPAQVVGIKDQLANLMLVDDLETISLRDFEALDQGGVQTLRQCL